jgi:hypothetical protein
MVQSVAWRSHGRLLEATPDHPMEEFVHVGGRGAAIYPPSQHEEQAAAATERVVNSDCPELRNGRYEVSLEHG